MKDLARRAARLVRRLAQWAVFGALVIIVPPMIFTAFEANAAGISPAALLIAVAAFSAIAVVLIPPLFFRLPQRAQIAGYVALVPAFIAVVATHSVTDTAYLKTPAGKAAAEAAAAAETFQRQLVAEKERRLASEKLFVEHEQNVAEMHRSVEVCINWRGQVPSLVKVVKEALHNPKSFEHVETQIKSVGQTPAVTMQYRAENGFGAIRAATVDAFIATDDCSVIAVDSAD